MSALTLALRFLALYLGADWLGANDLFWPALRLVIVVPALEDLGRQP